MSALRIGARRRALDPLLDEPAGAAGRQEAHGAARHATAVLPGMRHVARDERTGARPTGRHLVADLESELALQHPCDLIAVAVQMEPAVLGASRHCLLPQGDALSGLPTEQLHRRDLT